MLCSPVEQNGEVSQWAKSRRAIESFGDGAMVSSSIASESTIGLGSNSGTLSPQALLLARPRTKTALFMAPQTPLDIPLVSLPKENVALKTNIQTITHEKAHKIQ